MADVDLVLDLDATLLCSIFDQGMINSIEKFSDLPEINNRILIRTLIDGSDSIVRGMGTEEKIIFIKRPGLDKFLDYIFKKFKRVHIWSAGHFRYVKAIESLIFNDRPLDRILTRRETYITPQVVLKDLIANNFDLKKTLIIDDRDDTFAKNFNNAIHIPIYDPDGSFHSIVSNDDALLRIIDWFETSGILNCDDVRLIRKPNLF